VTYEVSVRYVSPNPRLSRTRSALLRSPLEYDVQEKEEVMTAKKGGRPRRKAKNLKVRKETLKDLEASRETQVKGGYGAPSAACGYSGGCGPGKV
jgi:hypothetical protein